MYSEIVVYMKRSLAAADLAVLVSRPVKLAGSSAMMARGRQGTVAMGCGSFAVVCFGRLRFYRSGGLRVGLIVGIVDTFLIC